MEQTSKFLFPGVQDGEAFMVGDIEFIKFPDQGCMTPVLAKDIAFVSDFGGNNNLAESKVLARMQQEFLPNVVKAVGEENICMFKTDLTTWDGLKIYGELESKISLPTMDFYRQHVDIFDQYKVNRWFWLATADSAKPHDDPWYVLCVSPSGGLNFVDCSDGYRGVRPFLYFDSSIFGPCEQ